MCKFFSSTSLKLTGPLTGSRRPIRRGCKPSLLDEMLVADRSTRQRPGAMRPSEAMTKHDSAGHQLEYTEARG